MKSKIFRSNIGKADSLAEAAGYYQGRTHGPRRAGDTRPAAVRLAESESGEDASAPQLVERSNPSRGTYTPVALDAEASARILRAIARGDGTDAERAAWQAAVDGGYCPFCVGRPDGHTDSVVCYCCRRSIAQ